MQQRPLHAQVNACLGTEAGIQSWVLRVEVRHWHLSIDSLVTQVYNLGGHANDYKNIDRKKLMALAPMKSNV